MNKYINNNYFVFAILSAVILLVYSPVWTAHQTMSPDAYFLLPFFDKMHGFSDYINHLIQLKAYDFQPVRDLSLYIDWYVFHHWGTNIFIFHNLLIWTFTCIYSFKILELLRPNLDRKLLLLLTLCYAVYPLFCASLAWSIARKHILALFFIVLATYFFLNFLKNKNKRDISAMCFFYFLSIFSQPIGILWPLWTLIYVYFFSKENLKSFIKPFIILTIIFIIAFVTNYLYYEKSTFFAGIFESKTNDAFNIGFKILAFGNYMYQLFFPYFQVFQYDLNYKYTLLGFLNLGIFISAYYLLNLPWKNFLVWAILGLIPIAVILNTPKLILDPYLLIPSVFILVISSFMIEKMRKDLFLVGAALLLITWGALTFKESKLWTNEIAFGMRNFETRPNCVNARSLASTLYAKGKIPPETVSQYIIGNQCFGFSTQYNRVEFIVFMSYVAYYENIGTIEEKIKLLNEYSKENFFPKLALAALLISNNREDEALAPIEEIANTLGDGKLDNMYDKVIPTIVHKYCERINHERCLKFSSQLSKIVELPYF